MELQIILELQKRKIEITKRRLLTRYVQICNWIKFCFQAGEKRGLILYFYGCTSLCVTSHFLVFLDIWGFISLCKFLLSVIIGLFSHNIIRKNCEISQQYYYQRLQLFLALLLIIHTSCNIIQPNKLTKLNQFL